uniref:Amidohydrolase family protein n=1 Tax=Roseihalotalea indica TaxID=2867963 RepID=A0AA49GR82_9BACT|nr:amidohydrolase family protein [Tunicatimonas sp. TK19036]
MRYYITLFTVLVASLHGLAQVPSPGEPQSEPIILRGATVHIGNGEVIENAAVAFREGKIEMVAQEDVLENMDVAAYKQISVQGQHIYPGFILPNTTLGLKEIGAVRATVDDSEQGTLNPNVRAVISYNTDSEVIPTLRFNGILLAQATPQGGMIPGTSSVMQLDAWNWEDAVVQGDDAMHLNWPGRFRQDFDYATYTVKRVKNEEYDEQRRMLEELFADATAYHQVTDPQELNLKLEALVGLFEGTKALHIHTDGAKEIIESIRFAEDQGVKNIVLVGGGDALLVKDFLKNRNIPVIVANTHVLPNQADNPVLRPYELPYLLQEAGLMVGLGYERSMNASARNLPFVAGTAAAHGLEKEAAVQLITQNNAQILGISDRYGTLEEGKSATLFVSEGDALDMRTNILSYAFVDGREVTLPALQQRLYEKYKEKYEDENIAQEPAERNVGNE